MIEFQSITNDGNGNPRYVIDYYHVLNHEENELPFSDRYPLAIKKANKIGGRKFHNKQYGGGLVFSTYNLKKLEEKILEMAQ